MFRHLAVLALAVLFGACSPNTEARPAAAPTTTSIAPIFKGDPLVGGGGVEVVGDGYGFLEGPQWVPKDGVLLFSQTSEQRNPSPKHPGTILQLKSDNVISVFRDTDVSNGLALDRQGRLLAAENVNSRVTRTETDGTVDSIADHFEGHGLLEPNDLAVRSDGTIYFTDPGGDAVRQANAIDFHGVFRIAPDGGLAAAFRGSLDQFPNGVVLSPDEKLLYVSMTFGGRILVFDVAADGSLSGQREFARSPGNASRNVGGFPDGMAVDLAGNLYVAVINVGVEVFAPDGTQWGSILLPSPGTEGHQPSNCAFGGADARTLYITSNGVLYRIRLQHPGIY
jgi:sugar lactone lactonase YvrE